MIGEPGAHQSLAPAVPPITNHQPLTTTWRSLLFGRAEAASSHGLPFPALVAYYGMWGCAPACSGGREVRIAIPVVATEATCLRFSRERGSFSPRCTAPSSVSGPKSFIA